MSNFVRNNWVSIPFFIISIIIAIYGVQKATYERELIFWCDDTEIETLFEHDRVSEAPIKIINKQDYSEINSDLFLVKFKQFSENSFNFPFNKGWGNSPLSQRGVRGDSM